jgi:CheY-like chemotaxis protein
MKKHILLIDDDNDELQILCGALNDAGIDYKCTWVQGVEHALRIMEYLVPDVIFIDHNMPPINGIDGIRLIRKRKELHLVPLVLYSNSVSKTSSADALKAGATTCIQKPSCMSDLTDTMKDFFIELDSALCRNHNDNFQKGYVV